jgi:hypothetical protein
VRETRGAIRQFNIDEQLFKTIISLTSFVHKVFVVQLIKTKLANRAPGVSNVTVRDD